MTIWIQLLVLIITNLPGIINSIKELFELFGRDKNRAKAALKEIRDLKGSDNRGARIRDILEKYAVK